MVVAGRLRLREICEVLAILPQAPLLSLTDQKTLLELRKAAELAALLKRKKAEKARIPPRFNTLRSLRAVLRAYEVKRPALRESDAAAAIVAIGRFGRDAADRQLADPFAASARVARIRADVARCVPALRSRELAGVLHGCALVRARAARRRGVRRARPKSDQLDVRDVSTSVNALGRLGLPHDALLPRLLARAERDARAMHAIELANVASGTLALLGPHHTPPRLLRAIAETAVLKIDQFGAEELGRLLASLTSHRLYDSRLLAAAGGALPLVIGDMSPTDFVRLSHAFASACAAKKWWEPVTLELLGGEAAARAPAFSAEQAARTLASFGRLGWDQRETTRALGRRIADEAAAGAADLGAIATGLRALSRLPSADPDDVAALVAAAADVPLPAADACAAATGAADLQRVSTLANALVHHGAPPPPPLLALVRALPLDRMHATAGTSDDLVQRSVAKLRHALRAWEAAAPERPRRGYRAPAVRSEICAIVKFSLYGAQIGLRTIYSLSDIA